VSEREKNMATTAHTAHLRALLGGGRIASLGGAHDALSARIIEECAFDGIWVSSFGISLAKRCLPDADLLTMTETLEEVRDIVSAVTVPVVADCNTGFGNVINVMRMVVEFERAGVAGICIEDNVFPKRCSLYEGQARELLPSGEMAAKIRAAKAAQRDPGFVVIARIEALIADLGVDEALERAAAYADAGADALLIHSKSFPLLRECVASWRRETPLVVVPTLFNDVSLAELEDCGFRVAIFANQAVRAAMRAMRDTMQAIRTTGVGRCVEPHIVPLSEVYEISNLAGMRGAERQFTADVP
jgi:phosphoenolpyruvate phosphomutase